MNDYSEGVTITSLGQDVCQALAEYEPVVAQRQGVSHASRPAVLRAVIRKGLIAEGFLPDTPSGEVSPDHNGPEGQSQDIAGTGDAQAERSRQG